MKYIIQPLSSQILFRVRDLAKPETLILLEGSAAQQACEVVAKGPDVSEHIQVSDLLILAEGMQFCGYNASGEILHLIPEGCVVGKYIEATEPNVVLN